MSEDWKELTLGDVAEVNPKETPRRDDAPFITMSDVAEWGTWAHSASSKGTRGGIRARGGDVLMARITPCLENGKIAMVPTNLSEVGGSTEFIVVRGTESALSTFLHLLVGSTAFHHQSVGLMTGTTGRQRVSASDVAAIKVRIPPPKTQRRIVAVIDSIDKQIAALDAERDALAQFLTSLLRDTMSSLG